jgi:hypothetical protein
MASGRSPTPATSSDGRSAKSQHDLELQRKRARDRKSQQAMRDRNKWAIDNLTEQVKYYTTALEHSTKDLGLLSAKIGELEEENEHLRVQNAALQLSLMGDGPQNLSGEVLSPDSTPIPPWERPTNVVRPTCLSDQILQDFVDSRRRNSVSLLPGSPIQASNYPSKPNLCSLINKEERATDEISNMVGDIVRSYTEIETLPKKVAVHCVMWALLKWMVLLDEESWNNLPVWLRPTESQTSIPHAAWIDRIPWPSARDYLIAHPNISLDHFAGTYSTSFFVRWEYNAAHVVVTTENSDGTKEIIPNPIYEEHVRQLHNWNVGHFFCQTFPEIAKLIEQDTQLS